VVLTAGWVSAATFTGADSADNLFSTTNNWDTFPTGTTPKFDAPSADATSADNPGQLDAAFNVLLPSGLGNCFLNGDGNGTVYIDVLSNAVWKSVNLTIGHQNVGVTARHGVLTLKSGSSLAPVAGNSGTLTLGGPADGSSGRLAAEHGATAFSFANLNLQAEGTLAFQFGTNSASTFISTRNNAAATMVLDGTVEVDLGALEQTGTYTLIAGSHVDSVLSGALITWLDSNGGTTNGTGNLNSDHFDVVNSPGVKWSLTTAAAGTELVLTVTGFVPIAERSLAASQDVGVRSTLANNRADTGMADGFLMFNSTTRGLLEFDLSAAEYEITNAVLKLTQIQNLTGTWEMSIYPLVYTSNNYNWYEGTGTALYATNEESPATNANTACYLYSRDDALSPVQWEDSAGTPMANIAQAAVWNSAIATVSGTDSVAGNQIVFNLDAAELEKMRTNGVERISLGIWGTTSLSGNYILASKDNDDPDYHPVLDLQMKSPLQAPVITGINVGSIAAGNRVEVTFDAEVNASLWFSPELVVPAWTNVAFGASPLLYTNEAPQGFYKVTASE
jgi:hypothetical protein